MNNPQIAIVSLIAMQALKPEPQPASEPVRVVYKDEEGVPSTMSVEVLLKFLNKK